LLISAANQQQNGQPQNSASWLPFGARRPEARGVERLGVAAIEAEPAAGAVEAHAQHVGVGAVAHHAL
jgi:hypothetical protein